VLVCIRCHDYRYRDVVLATLLYASVPCHLFVAHLIELRAAQHAKGVIGKRKKDGDGTATPKEESFPRKPDPTWRYVAIAHGLNATLCLGITTTVVFNYIHHPLIGTICQTHAIIVWLKNCSYAFTNRDLRHAMLHPNYAESLPETYAECPYPRNITLGNLSYFWWAPTLVYQPVYPRTAEIRWMFIFKRIAEVAGLSMLIWLASAQYAAPLLRNSLNKIMVMDLAHILERLMKLSTISLIVWLAGFFAIFQSSLNALAEIMRFGDRDFYSDWWNSPSVGAYWRSWNKPVYVFMRRHIYQPLLGRGWKPQSASIMVFVFSGVLHEILVGVPTHNILGGYCLRRSNIANRSQASHFWVWSSRFPSL
jgi:diacylglycerol O-acyltransferase 1